jgi:hypothetical protein
MKYFLLFFCCLFSKIIVAQSNINNTLTIDYQSIKSNIASLKLATKGNIINEKFIIKLLIPSGEERTFEIEETSNFASELATKHPEIQTFVGICLDDKMLSVRFDISPLGYSATYINQGKITIIEPKDLSKNLYAVVPFDDVQNGWECGNATLKSVQKNQNKKNFSPNVINNGAFLKTLRIAIATTAEFTINNGGVSNALARINSLLTIVNAIYIPDLAIKFELIANNTSIIFTNASTDPFNPTASYAPEDSQNAFDDFNTNNYLLYGSYDIAHALHANTTSTGSISSGGVAYIGVVCSNFSKALGWTQYTANNTNTSINSVAGGILTHELGHQMGANHNFNGQGNNCTSQLGDQFEPGSGSTIMAYLGLCGSQNLTGNKDNFFHIASLESILYELSFSPTCGTNTALTNALPVVNAGADYTVPSNTPFVLKGTATDANNDPLSYTWEQKDEGVYNDAGALGQTNGVGGYPAVRSKKAPLFRTKQSTTTATRSFPAETFVLNNANNPNDNEGEDLSVANRVMTFSLTARDYKTGGGGTVSDEVIITVDSLKGPFLVTYPNTPISLGAGTSQTITWSVNNTNLLSPNIDILISTNGSNSNPTFTVLASNTLNDGSETVTIPTTLTSQARIKIVSKNSSTAEFYDISNVNFSIVTACPTSNVVFSSNKTGLWSDLTVWNCGSIATNRLPNITDTVKINTGHIVTLDINASVKILNLIGRLNMNSGRVLSY